MRVCVCGLLCANLDTFLRLFFVCSLKLQRVEVQPPPPPDDWRFCQPHPEPQQVEDFADADEGGEDEADDLPEVVKPLEPQPQPEPEPEKAK